MLKLHGMEQNLWLLILKVTLNSMVELLAQFSAKRILYIMFQENSDTYSTISVHILLEHTVVVNALCKFWSLNIRRMHYQCHYN